MKPLCNILRKSWILLQKGFHIIVTCKSFWPQTLVRIIPCKLLCCWALPRIFWKIFIFLSFKELCIRHLIQSCFVWKLQFEGEISYILNLAPRWLKTNGAKVQKKGIPTTKISWITKYFFNQISAVSFFKVNNQLNSSSNSTHHCGS